jgi:light-regulated signal transduction histidine kinase (bacteriophytochrome)
LTAPDHDGQDTVKAIEDIGKALFAQNDKLQAYARILTRQQHYQTIPLGSVVEEIVKDQRTDLDRLGGSIEIGYLPEVVGDPEQIRVLFQILIENALQYSRPDVPPRVQIGSAQDGEWRVISVHDNGRGFDETYLANIMRPFKRLVAKSDVRGTGLGLSLVKRIVDFHGGELSASSEIDQGSQFCIRCRLHDEDGHGATL